MSYDQIVFPDSAPPKIASFSFGDEPLNFGESASAQCTINGGDLPMRVEWLLNGMEIPSYLEVTTSQIGKRINVLSIESVKAAHMANYSCRVTNKAGTAEFTAPLTVIGLFLVISQRSYALICIAFLNAMDQFILVDKFVRC